MRQWWRCSPCCRLLIVKSGLSWGICQGRALYPRLWTCSRFPLVRLGGKPLLGGWALNFMRPGPHPIVLKGRQRVAGYHLEDAETEQMHANPWHVAEKGKKMGRIYYSKRDAGGSLQSGHYSRGGATLHEFSMVIKYLKHQSSFIYLYLNVQDVFLCRNV